MGRFNVSSNKKMYFPRVSIKLSIKAGVLEPAGVQVGAICASGHLRCSAALLLSDSGDWKGP